MIKNFLLFSLFGLLLCAITPSEAAPQPAAKKVRPGAIFLSGYYSICEADKLVEQKHFQAAWNKYHQALRYYQSLANNYPKWKPNLVAMRLRTTNEKIKQYQPLALQEHANKQQKIKQYLDNNTSENGIKSPQLHNLSQSDKSKLLRQERIINEYKNQIKLLKLKHKQDTKDLRARLAKLSDKLRKAQQGLGHENTQVKILNNQTRKLIEQIKKLDQKNNQAQADLLALLDQLNRERAKLAAAPLRQDVEKLEREKKRYEAELDLIYGTHKRLLKSHKKLQQERDNALNELKLAQLALENKSKLLASSKNASHKIVSALRRQIKAQQQQITSLQQQVNMLDAENKSLKTQLADAHAINDELKNEINAITLERDKLSELLNLSDVDRTKRTIKEALRLGKELSEAKLTIKQILADKNAAQDEVLEAKNNLAVAKQKIINLQNDNTDYIRRLGKLEDTLKDTKDKLELALQNQAASPEKSEEASVLKKALQRITAKLERKKEAEKLLWEEFKRSGIPGSPIGKAIAKLIQNEVTLTKEETKLLNTRADTDRFRLSGASPLTPAARKAAQQRSKYKIQSIEALALRCIEKGKLTTAKEVYDEAYDEYGYYYPFFINRAVVRFDLGEFEEAEEIFESGSQLKEKNPYTHFMLGVCRFKNHKDELAKKSLQTAVDLRPDYTDAYIYLSLIAHAHQNYSKAQSYLEKAVRINPENAIAQRNLAQVYHLQGKNSLAKKAYNNALKAGLTPDFEFEKQIGIHSN